MKTPGWILLGLLAALVIALAAAILRTLRMPRYWSDYVPDPDPTRADAYARILSAMVRYETVSRRDDPEPEKFRGFHALLETLFPTVHQELEKTEIDGNLLFFWPGRRHDRPLVLMSHQDVVPAEGSWAHAPFSGDIADGKVWGRGSADTKCTVMAFFQAAEELLKAGFVPEQDVYLASSCTEEFGGDGAPKLVAELQRRGVRPFLVCDEGGAIIQEPVSGVPGYFAMVGVFEKGQGNVRVTARSDGGHASAPPRRSPIPRLAAFVCSMERHSPFRKKLLPEVRTMFENFAPYAPFGLKLLFGNLWLFGPLLELVMPLVSPQAAAMLSTTAAFTMASGSDAYNVLPQEASVWVNLRFIPHEGMKKSMKKLRRRARRFGLEVEVISDRDYTGSADIYGKPWDMVMDAIGECFPGLPASPYVVTGGTDARFFQEICPNCVRFAPVTFGPEQMHGMHGLNENLEIACLPGAVDFYKTLIRKNG
ncbi:MAG: M20/M25/M40 family metallo-hydrolase [Oscillospiraceae bacterium]|nr:M20/M25/M40 family metallo-hydrolase [Oscillospiraceae bacterium]